MGKIFVIRFIAVISIFIFFSCSFKPENANNNTSYCAPSNVVEKYSTLSHWTRNMTQYNNYYFLANESRNIIVTGKYLPSCGNTDLGAPEVYVEGQNITSEQVYPYKKIEDSYFQKYVLQDKEDVGFVYPVKIKTSFFASGTIPCTLHIGTLTYSFNIHVRPSRIYTVDYYNMGSDCDLISNGHVLKTCVADAYEEAATAVEFREHNSEQIAHKTIQLDQYDLNYSFYAFVNNNLAKPNDPENGKCLKIEGKTYLIGGYMTIPTTLITGETLAGYTVHYPQMSKSTDPICVYSFVFPENIKTVNNNLDKVRKLVTYNTIHELGHARATKLHFTDEDDYFERNLTDNEHTGGHNGEGNTSCIMFWLNSSISAVNDAILARMGFCSGHKQMLYNAGK